MVSMFKRVCPTCKKVFETTDFRVKYCSDECRPPKLLKVLRKSHQYYLNRKKKNPEREKIWRKHSRERYLAKIKALKESLILKISPNRQCQACGSTEHIELHHRYYRNQKEKILMKTGHGSNSLYMAQTVFDNPERFRVLCSECHKVLGLLIKRSPDVARKLLEFADEDRKLASSEY